MSSSDLRFSLRNLAKHPAFTVIALLTLALGIGATAAVFSLVQSILLTPPPYRHPNQIALIVPARTDGEPVGNAQGWAAEQWMDWQQHSASFEKIAAYSWTFNFLVLHDGSQSLQGMIVSRDYFHLLGVKPLIGRTFSDLETAFPSKPVIILGFNVWKQKFAGDPAILGKKIRISRQDTPLQVIGVMPPDLRFLPSPTTAQEPNYNPNATVDFWIPGAPDPKNSKRAVLNIVARLKNGVDARSAQQELTVMVQREAQQERSYAGVVPRVEPLVAELNRDGDRILWPLFGAAVLVLLIACGNAGSLMLVRGIQRQQEYSVRSALGVGRLHLIWQASLENLLIALGGGVLGMALAFGLTNLLKIIGVHAIPRLDSVSTGWPILLCGLAAALMSAALAGFVPAFRASKVNAADVLKSAGPKSSTGTAEKRFLRIVAIAQTALTLALLVGAGLLVKTMRNLSDVHTGYDVSHILTMSVTAVQGNWNDFHRRALERVSALPDVQYAAFAWGVPLTGNNWPDAVEIEGQPPVSRQSDLPSLPLRSVTENYFKLIGTPLLEGRPFRSSDTDKNPPVAIVNRALVDRYFPHQNAIGKKLWLRGRDHPANQIIGIVENSRTDDLTEKPQPEIYLSFWQAGPFSKHLVIRTSADPRIIASTVQHELRTIDPTIAVEQVKTMREIRTESVASRTFATQLLTGFSLMGGVLTLIGIYGVLSLSVASRRRELAIRTALGAERRDIRTLVLSEGFRLIGAGIILGLASALVLSRVLRTFLFQVEPDDPRVLLIASVSFAIVSLLACWVPSRRAAGVDPAEALRYE